MKVLRYMLLARLAIGGLAVSTKHNLEIAKDASIIRNERRAAKAAASSMMIATASMMNGNPVMELNPQIMGDEASTTMIVQSGAGPTTTAIYAVGAGPLLGPAKNAIDLTPAPPNYYEPGPPGIPGPPGPPGSPGDPGPPEGFAAETSAATTEGPLLHSSAGSAPTGVHTQSGYEIRGPPGGPGPEGDAGPPGVIGSMGLEGEIGIRGEQGFEGPKGEQGPPGQRRHVNAPPKQWMYYGLAINIFIGVVVLIMSYVEFVGCGGKKKAAEGGGEAWEQ